MFEFKNRQPDAPATAAEKEAFVRDMMGIWRRKCDEYGVRAALGLLTSVVGETIHEVISDRVRSN